MTGGKAFWIIAMLLTCGWLADSAMKTDLSEAETEINCIIAIRNIEHDVGRENRDVVCEVAKTVRMKFEGTDEQAVNCEPTCRRLPPVRSKSDR